MPIKPLQPADFYFTYPVNQFLALAEAYNLVEEHFNRGSREGATLLVADGNTPAETVKVQFQWGVVNAMMPQAYRGAFLMALWGSYEATVIIVTRSIEKALGDRPDMPKLEFGTGWLDSASKHFPAHFGFPLLPRNVPTIQQEVTALQKIRNVFAHANGLEQIVESERNWEYLASDYAPKHQGIDLSRGFLEVSGEFVRGRFDMMRPVFSHLVREGRAKLTELGIPHPLNELGPTDQPLPSRFVQLWQAVKQWLRK